MRPIAPGIPAAAHPAGGEVGIGCNATPEILEDSKK